MTVLIVEQGYANTSAEFIDTYRDKNGIEIARVLLHGEEAHYPAEFIYVRWSS